ncbi:hypothetical protein [Thermocrinis sp.]
MRFLLYFLFFTLLLFILSYLIYLNRFPTEFVLTPEFNGVYYRIPPVPLGLLVVGAVLLGFFIGYLFALISKR